MRKEKTINQFNPDIVLHDKNTKPIVLEDYVAKEIVGVQIGNRGHKLWVCIDGIAVLRVTSPKIELTDMRLSCKKTE